MYSEHKKTRSRIKDPEGGMDMLTKDKNRRESFLMYDSIINALLEVGAETAFEFLKAIADYRNGQKIKFDQPIKQALWMTFKGQLDRDSEKYDSIVAKRKEAGKAGAEKRWQAMANDGKNSKCHDNMANDGKRWQAMANDGLSDTDTVSEKEKNIIDIPKEKPSANAPASSFAKRKGFKTWNESDFRKNVDDAVKEDPNLGTFSNEFCEYWTERTPTGRMRFQTEKTWETPKRLVRWKNNSFSKFHDEGKDAGLSNLPTAEQLLATEGNHD